MKGGCALIAIYCTCLVLQCADAFTIVRGRLYNTEDCSDVEVMNWEGIDTTCMPIHGTNWAVPGGLRLRCENNQVQARAYSTYDCTGNPVGSQFTIGTEACVLIDNPFVEGVGTVSGFFSCEESESYFQTCIYLGNGCFQNRETRCVASSTATMCMNFGDQTVFYTCKDEIPSIVYDSSDCSGDPVIDGTVAKNACSPTTISGVDVFEKVDCVRGPKDTTGLEDGSNGIIIEDNTRGRCFAADSHILLEDGSMKRLRHVQVGDIVESYDLSGKREFSEVFLIQHEGVTAKTPMRTISFSSQAHGEGLLTVTDSHLLLSSMTPMEYRKAGDLKYGDKLFLSTDEGIPEEVEIISIEKSFSEPRNIHTMNDRIVVNNVLTSPYTVSHGINTMKLRAFLLPVKLAHRLGLRIPAPAANMLLEWISRRLGQLQASM